MKRCTHIIIYIFAVIPMIGGWACKKQPTSTDTGGRDADSVFRSPDLTYQGLVDSVKDVLVRHYEAEMIDDSLVIDRSAAQYVICQTFDDRGFVSSNAMRIYTAEFPNGQVYNDFKFKFDDDGKLIWSNPSLKSFNIERNDAGYMVEFSYTSADDSSLSYKKMLTWNELGQLVNLTYANEGETSEDDYAYDDRGLLSKVVSINTFGDVREESEKTFKYTAFDSRNNWTRRETVTVVVSTEVGQEPTRHVTYSIETRDISYY